MKVQIYKDDAGEWRWRLKARNGRVMADSGEGYTSRRGAKRAADTLGNACLGGNGTKLANAFWYPEVVE